MEYEFHEAANIFPLDEEHIGELAEDIRRNKQQVPIEIFDGKVIDGRRRYLACNRVGIAPKFREVSIDDPIAYVLSLNLHRRHLTPTQLAMVGARARTIYDQQAKERQRLSEGRGVKKGKENLPYLNPEQGQARDQAAKAVGVSGKSIDHATRVLHNATPALVAAVDADQIAVSTAARVSGFSEEEQNAIAERAAENAKHGRQRKPRPTESIKPESEEIKQQVNGDVKGVGIIQANEAINCLIRIPKNDPLRKRGFQIVTDWIKANR